MTNSDQLNRILGEVSDLPVEDREAAIDERCGTDSALALEVRGLLRLEADVRTRGTWAGAPVREIASMPSGFEIRSTLGTGGMGTVYLAEQVEPIRREVALKVLRLDLDSERFRARFELEKDALARLEHPHIAKILDAGTTPSGQPYFAMEYVRGVAIDRYCDERRLPLAARLRLLAGVCSAIQHAHQKGIIHRDIKPSNVLISDESGAPIPKVIDFGIAKAVAATGAPSVTAEHQFVGTIAYMSPEQLREDVEVDTRTDVFSIGVLMYEMLTGSTLLGERVKSASLLELAKRISEPDHPRPSDRVRALPIEESERVAELRQTTVRQLDRALHGDLDWIVLRALETDRDRRYPTVQQLREDIERSLRDQPVSAGPPSAAYRFHKFVRRNRVSVSLVALIVLVVAIGFVATYRAFRRASAAEDVASQSRTDALDAANEERLLRIEYEELSTDLEAVVAHMQRALRLSDVATTPGEKLTRRQLLDTLATDIELLEPYPAWHASSNALIGNGYYRLGELDLAADHFRRADAIHAALQGREIRFSLRTDEVRTALRGCSNPLDWLKVKHGLQRALTDGIPVSDWEREAYTATLGCWYLGAHVLERHGGGLGAPAQRLLDATVTLIAARFRETDELLGIRRGAFQLAAAARELSVDDPLRSVVDGQLWVAGLLLENSAIELPRNTRISTRAREVFEALYELRVETLPALHPEIGAALAKIAEAALRNGRNALAVQRAEQALDLRREVYGEDHEAVVTARALLGRAQIAAGARERGIELLEASLPSIRDKIGPVSSEYLVALEALLVVLSSSDTSAAQLRALRADLVHCYRARPISRAGTVRRRRALFYNDGTDIGASLEGLWKAPLDRVRSLLDGLLVEIERRGLGDDDVIECIAGDLGNFAQYVVRLRPEPGWLEFAVDASDEVLAMYGRAGVPTAHPMRLATRFELARAHGLLGNPSAQEEHARAVLAGVESIASDPTWWSDDVTFDARAELALSLIAQQRESEAVRELVAAEQELDELDLVPAPLEKRIRIVEAYSDISHREDVARRATRLRKQVLELAGASHEVALRVRSAWAVAQFEGLADGEYRAGLELVEDAFAEAATREVARELMLVQSALEYRRGAFGAAREAAREASVGTSWARRVARAMLALCLVADGEASDAAELLLSRSAGNRRVPPIPVLLKPASDRRILREAERAVAPAR